MKEFAARELAAIDAIDAAIATEHRPDYAMLLHAAKDGHQTAYGQLAALAHLEGRSPAPSAGLAGLVATWQTRLTQLIGHSLTLHAMRAVEDHLVESYREAAGAASGVRKEALSAIADHAQARSTILSAHVGDTKRLPLPLTAYFASEQRRACMRCHVDRPGTHPTLERTDPVTSLCAACHDETRTAFPPELIPLLDSWPRAAYEARIIEKALGKPSKETVKKQVHRVLAGLPPVTRKPPRTKQPAGRGGPSPAVDAPAPQTLALDDASPSERAYCEQLFDPARMRKSW